MARSGILALSVALNLALVAVLCLQFNSRQSGLETAISRTYTPRVVAPVRSYTAPMRRSVSSFAKASPKDKMVPDRNPRPDEDIVPRDGSFWDMMFNEWITKKSPTRSIVLDRQAEMNANGEGESVLGFLGNLQLPSGGELPGLSLEGLQELSLDPTIKKTTKSAPVAKKTIRGKKTAPPAKPQGGFSLPNFLKPYDDNKLSYSDMLNKKK